MLPDPMRRISRTERGPSRATLVRHGFWLEYLTLGWNVVGSAVVLIAAFNARSVALAGFGLDSLIEIFASVVVIWQLAALRAAVESDAPTVVHQVVLRREKVALRLIGLAFFGLAIYVALQSLFTAISQRHPLPSPLGLTWLAATLIAMLLLALGKRITGEQLGNPVLMTEARVTLIDAALAGAVLLGLALNALFGWWWADPLAGLVIVYYGAKEGLAAWRG
jgi:divalent metal cation (Fe/Co/Zn/Cd) transporter